MLWICKRVTSFNFSFVGLHIDSAKNRVLSCLASYHNLRYNKLTSIFKSIFRIKKFSLPQSIYRDNTFFHFTICDISISGSIRNYDLRFLHFALRFENIQKIRLFVSKSLLRSIKRQIATRVRPRIETLFSSKKTLKRRIITTTYFRDHKETFFFNLFQR